MSRALPFSTSEIGLFKSTVLVNRLNLFWGLNWQASTEYLTRKTEGKTDIIIFLRGHVCARFEIIKSPLFKEYAYWLDIGNTADRGQFVLGEQEITGTAERQIGCPPLQSCFRKSSNQASIKTTTCPHAAPSRLLSVKSRLSIRYSGITASRCLPAYSIEFPRLSSPESGL
jgi:hypothetical protein